VIVIGAFLIFFGALFAVFAAYIAREYMRDRADRDRVVLSSAYDIREATVPVRRLPACPFPEAPRPGGFLPPWAIQDSDHLNPPAGDEDPGPGSLPEGDTRLLWPPQEAPGPGDLLAKARAAIDGVQAITVDDYLSEVEAATAWAGDRPFTDWERDSVVMPTIKAEVRDGYQL
jgi:hypothetical protein